MACSLLVFSLRLVTNERMNRSVKITGIWTLRVRLESGP